MSHGANAVRAARVFAYPLISSLQDPFAQSWDAAHSAPTYSGKDAMFTKPVAAPSGMMQLCAEADVCEVLLTRALTEEPFIWHCTRGVSQLWRCRSHAV